MRAPTWRAWSRQDEQDRQDGRGGIGAIPEVIRNIDSFTLGARSVNPKATVKVVWVNKWFDPGKEREAATTLIGQGVDMLMQNTDSAAVVQTAQEKGVHAFGWDSDMSKFGDKAHLAASVISWGVYYNKVVEDVLSKQWKNSTTWWGLKEGMIDLKGFNAEVPADVKALVEARKKGIADAARRSGRVRSRTTPARNSWPRTRWPTTASCTA